MVDLQLKGTKRYHFYFFFTPKWSKCVTLLGCGHLGNSESRECAVTYCTDATYKRAEAPTSQNIVALATIKFFALWVPALPLGC